ncbi:MAG: PPOX class F420-dependent oxidoreductase [Candidatus Promineifilaceae bacterium]
MQIPDSHRDLFDKPICGILTTVDPNGQPQNSVIWCDYDGEHVRVNTAAGRKKDRNVRHNQKVALIVVDPNDEMRWIDVRGFVEQVDHDADCAHIDSLAQQYRGYPQFFGHAAPLEAQATQKRIIFRIKPENVVTLS